MRKFGQLSGFFATVKRTVAKNTTQSAFFATVNARFLRRPYRRRKHSPTDAENTVQSAFFATVSARFLRQPSRRRMGVWLQGMKKQEGGWGRSPLPAPPPHMQGRSVSICKRNSLLCLCGTGLLLLLLLWLLVDGCLLFVVCCLLLVGKGVAARGGNLKKTSWRGVGGRAQRLPPRCIGCLCISWSREEATVRFLCSVFMLFLEGVSLHRVHWEWCDSVS